MEDSHAYGIAAGAGVVLWVATAAIGGRTEAWDVSGYWVVTYPLAILVAGYLGYAVPRRAWRWGLTILSVQALALTVMSASFTMLPLGLIVFALLSLPAIWAAQLAAKYRQRHGSP